MIQKKDNGQDNDKTGEFYVKFKILHKKISNYNKNLG